MAVMINGVFDGVDWVEIVGRFGVEGHTIDVSKWNQSQTVITRISPVTKVVLHGRNFTEFYDTHLEDGKTYQINELPAPKPYLSFGQAITQATESFPKSKLAGGVVEITEVQAKEQGGHPGEIYYDLGGRKGPALRSLVDGMFQEDLSDLGSGKLFAIYYHDDKSAMSSDPVLQMTKICANDSVPVNVLAKNEQGFVVYVHKDPTSWGSNLYISYLAFASK